MKKSKIYREYEECYDDIEEQMEYNITITTSIYDLYKTLKTGTEAIISDYEGADIE